MNIRNLDRKDETPVRTQAERAGQRVTRRFQPRESFRVRQRETLGEIGHRLGRKALAAAAKPVGTIRF